MTRFEWFVAGRYLRSKRKVQFVSVINLISLTGVTIGVAALLVVLSVFNGFNSVVTSVLTSFDPHLRIEKAGGMTEDEYRDASAILASDARVTGFSPFVVGKSMIVSKSSGKVAFVKGVDEEMIRNASGLGQKIVLGALSLRDTMDRGSIVMGLTLADRLGAAVGDDVGVASPSVMNEALRPFAQVMIPKFTVRGVFESNNKEYDANYAYVSVPAAQSLFEMGNRISGIEVRLHSMSLTEALQAELSSALHHLQVVTWYDLHKDLYSVMKIERWVAYIILCLIIVVATFNMLGSLTMTVIEKRRDIGVLKAIGATSRTVTRIFMIEGLAVGVFGTILGIGLGLGLLYLQTEYHLFPLDTSVYIIPAIPVEIHTADFVVVALASMVACGLATYHPARRAAGTIPVEAIRWE